MKRITVTLFLGFGLLIPSVSAGHNNPVTKFLIQPAVNSRTEARRCTLVEDQPEMNSELSRIGWPFSKSKPSIDWTKDCAIIISPGASYFGARLAFIDLIWHGGKYHLRWGFWNSSIKVYGRSITTGYETPPLPPQEILIVVIKQYVHANNKLVCQEYVSRKK